MCGGGGKGSSGGSGAFGGYAAGLPPAQQNFTQASPEAMGWYRNAMDSGPASCISAIPKIWHSGL